MGSFTKGEQILILFIVLIALFSLGYKFLLQDFIKPETPTLALVDLPDNTSLTPLEEENPIIMVHISGQIFNPGVYEVVRDDRVIDVVELAGGLTKEADSDRINLAKKVVDEEKIYIPKIGESNEPILFQPSSTGNNNSLNSNIININTATIDELDSLPGVGKVIAQRIVDYRSTSPFKSVDDLKNVSGIGDKIFAGLKDLISVK